MGTISLANLNYDVLIQICSFVNTTPGNTTDNTNHPLDSLSRTSKLFRSLCFPDLHREITFRGDNHYVFQRLQEGRESEAFVEYVRFG